MNTTSEGQTVDRSCIALFFFVNTEVSMRMVPERGVCVSDTSRKLLDAPEPLDPWGVRDSVSHVVNLDTSMP